MFSSQFKLWITRSTTIKTQSNNPRIIKPRREFSVEEAGCRVAPGVLLMDNWSTGALLPWDLLELLNDLSGTSSSSSASWRSCKATRECCSDSSSRNLWRTSFKKWSIMYLRAHALSPGLSTLDGDCCNLTCAWNCALHGLLGSKNWTASWKTLLSQTTQHKMEHKHNVTHTYVALYFAWEGLFEGKKGTQRKRGCHLAVETLTENRRNEPEVSVEAPLVVAYVVRRRPPLYCLN